MSADDPLQEGLVCTEEMPLAWAVADALPASSALAGLHVSNEALIRACEALEETHRPAAEDASELAHELVRIDSKLNLVLELLGDWLRAQGDSPPAYRVRFNASGMEWQAPEGPTGNVLLHLSLWLCPAFPKPLHLHGEVVDVGPGTSGPVRILVRFVGMSDSVRDGLERLIFRRHRREVAQIRGQR